MASKELKYSAALERCRKNIEKTKGFIEYHKKMLKIFESKESRLMAKLENEKIAALRRSISDNGYDLDAICSAVADGDFSKVKASENINETAETIAPEITDIPEADEENEITEENLNGNDKGSKH